MSSTSELLGASGYIDHVVADGRRIGEVVTTGPLDAPVPSCPGWTLLDLVHHVGYIHRWARLAAATGARPDDASIDAPPSIDGLDDRAARIATAAWFEDGVDALATNLATLDPAAPTWHPFTVARVAGLWPRRQAHETSVHRWDAEAAIGATTPLDPLLAADGIAEYFEVIVPRLVRRDERTLPIGTFEIACTDVGAHLSLTSTDGAELTISRTRPVEAPDAVLAGDAETLLLALWNRRPLADPPEHALARDWLALGGN